MKNRMFVALIALMALILAAPASAQQLFPEAEEFLNPEGRSKIKPSTFNFLKVTTNARIAGMGDAFTAVSDGMDGIVWNPAGLTRVNKFGYNFGYTQWLIDSKFVTGSVAYNTDGWGVIGVSFVNFSLPDMVETTTLQPDGTGQKVDSGDLAVGLVYAYQLTDKLSAAATLRFIQSTLGPETLSAISVNVSTLMNTGFRSLRIGMNMKNLGGEQEIVSEKSEMPLVFHTGVAMEVLGNLGEPVSLTGSFEGAFFTDREQRWNLGGELWLKNMVALRAGYKFKYDVEAWSIGGGLKGTFGGRSVAIDVSYSDFGGLLDAPLRLSFSGAF
ncbi:MAG: PorV/PorQ family protein [bacterium]|nr:PorV/PorQ family protein [bacterium]